MTQENIIVLVILAVSVILFVSERLRVDLIAMLVLITLSLTGLVTIEEAFSGFASPAVITVWSALDQPGYQLPESNHEQGCRQSKIQH